MVETRSHHCALCCLFREVLNFFPIQISNCSELSESLMKLANRKPTTTYPIPDLSRQQRHFSSTNFSGLFELKGIRGLGWMKPAILKYNITSHYYYYYIIVMSNVIYTED